ncbi:MAG: flagellar export protein FliJ [Christensenellales bacterium]
MKQFKFTLQALWDITILSEKQVKIRIKKIEQRLSEFLREQEEMKKSFTNTKTKYLYALNKGSQTHIVAQYIHYFDNLNSLMDIQTEKINKLEREKQKLGEEQIRIRKELKTLEKLRENQYSQYMVEVKREDEKVMGDLVSYKVAATCVR